MAREPKSGESKLLSNMNGAGPVGLDAKRKSLDEAVSRMEKTFGKGAVMRLGERIAHAGGDHATGSLSLDLALGGGLPRGRLVEIFGAEGGGKTTLTLHCMAEAQKAGGMCAFIDAEHALDPGYARALGVDVDNLYVSQPDNGEQALEIADTLMRCGAIDCIVIDSVAALTPRAEVEGEMGDLQVGAMARMMSQGCRKLASTVGRAQRGGDFHQPDSRKSRRDVWLAGNHAGRTCLEVFRSACECAFRVAKRLRIGTEQIGNRTKVAILKNKIAPPFRDAEFDLIYRQRHQQIRRYSRLGGAQEPDSKRRRVVYRRRRTLSGPRQCARVFGTKPGR